MTYRRIATVLAQVLSDLSDKWIMMSGGSNLIQMFLFFTNLLTKDLFNYARDGVSFSLPYTGKS